MRSTELWMRIRPYVMIAPAMTGIVLFVLYPVAYLGYLSFHKYNLLNPSKSRFVGWENYIRIFTREDFYRSVLNTAVYTLGVVVLTLVLALLAALWLRGSSRWNAFVRAGIFTPHIVSIVSIALVWMWLMEPNLGLLNFMLKAVGLPPSPWLQSSATAMASVILVSVWHNVGYYTLIIFAALQSVPPSLYEAAALDQASRSRVFFRITLPMISPQLFFILIVMTIGSFKVFDTVQIMTGGGPNGATETLVYYIYSYRTTNIGFASATGVVLMAIIGGLTLLYFRFLSRKVHYQ
ncbi:carbohydrate ABC transporter permease [Paenibacillus mucilaginosus]|uniref:Binding-protein-dependent transport systems inner membrane component n=2 Tax=Paenibacillus mucilaginosus TaxID=61624 RepID=H6NEI0_9BACL|nr:sugar ABC transporter permease [Paenibacillus mucilaginosus]AFC28123.1 binding-protein-dependent transport systems inner membrane component [Paenibacillus mucilaginosus 3016]MCG7214295.1 sugar ABC transporter permease [Paenibacillus mucilaginosus]WDM28803.1 sugar ABC transporter permease [Paenibacillus mucilaginosus]WFA16967.1 sugar ABC transporter permease [Paenibacillus mucilaginosus]